MRPFLILAIAVLDTWAIASVLASGRSRPARILWTLAIIGIPVAGALGWLLRGRSRR